MKGFVLSGAVVGLSPLGPTGAGAGSTWLESPVPSPSLYSDLQSVSCTSGSSCIAVGNQSDGSVEQTLVEAWDGTTWTVVPSPAPGPTSHLNSVVCTSASDCVAVGVTSSGAYQTLIEMWDGSAWSVAPSPNPSNVDVLNDVTCTDPSNCVAVGSQQTGAGPQALIEAWDGTTWTVVPSAATDAAIVLSGISCTSASDCVAVGLSASTANQPLIETWDGTNWAVTPSPSSSVAGVLNGVSCTSESSCVAVGYAGNANGSQDETLVESWDGTAWSVIPSVSPVSPYSELFGISCATASDCVSVGEVADVQGARTLIETWDGTAWSLTPSPTLLRPYSDLWGVTCISPSNCEAVGQSRNGQALVETNSYPPGSTSTSASVSPSSVSAGSFVTYSAAVTGPGTATGIVTFTIGSTLLCTATLSGGTGSCTTSNAPVGVDTVTATYSGDTEFAPSFGTTILTVTLIPTTITPYFTPWNPVVGSPVTFGALISPYWEVIQPSGTVTFSIGDATLCTAPVSGGGGSCSATTAPLGFDEVHMSYSGDGNFASSSDDASLMVTNPAPSVTCSKVGGNVYVSHTTNFTSCVPPMGRLDKKATTPGGYLSFSGFSLTWSRTNQSTLVSFRQTLPGQGACNTKSTEREHFWNREGRHVDVHSALRSGIATSLCHQGRPRQSGAWDNGGPLTEPWRPMPGHNPVAGVRRR